jgi:hypothetical protein
MSMNSVETDVPKNTNFGIIIHTKSTEPIKDQQPLPKDQQPLPKDQQPLPKDQQPLPKDQQPLPKDQQPLPKDQQPLPKDQQPLPKDQQPLPIKNRQPQLITLKAVDWNAARLLQRIQTHGFQF